MAASTFNRGRNVFQQDREGHRGIIIWQHLKKENAGPKTDSVQAMRTLGKKMDGSMGDGRRGGKRSEKRAMSNLGGGPEKCPGGPLAWVQNV